MEQPETLDIAVNQIPHHGENHNRKRHASVAFQKERKYKRPLEIMKLKEQEKEPVRHILRHPAVERE